MRYSSKKELIADIERQHEIFLDLAATISTRRYREPGVWGDDWNIKDLFAHLTEWEQLFLTWYRAGVAGDEIELPAPGYKWNETPRLNDALWKRNRNKSWKRVREEFDASFHEILEVARGIPPRKLLSPGVYPWTRRNAVIAYLAANTSSHYRTATKILKRWLRSQT